jgi:prepilin-type N-terminal cleavage/methylation domain-containing protein
MLRSPSRHSPNHARSQSSGFTLIEVMVAISIAAGVISLLVPALLRQVAISEESNRLTTVEAVVSSDIYRFSNYAKIWKLKTGSYPVTKQLTMTSSVPRQLGTTTYDPPVDECRDGTLAISLLNDGSRQTPNIFKPAGQLTTGNSDAEILNPLDLADRRMINTIGSNVLRRVDAVGSKIRLFYYLPTNNTYGINFSREALVLVEAAVWCDRLP